MSKRRCNFIQTEVKRGLQALKDAGAAVKRVVIDGSKIEFVLDGDATDDTSAENELDKWMAAHADATEGH